MLSTQLNIGIIGSGNIGSLLAKRFVSMGHTVSIANSRGPESLAAVAAETGATPATVREAVQGKDVVVIAITQEGILNLPKDLFIGTTGHTIVVDTGNYYPGVRDIRIEAIEAGLPESVWVSQQLNVPIIKAFNNMTSVSLSACALPKGAAGRLCLAVAGDISADKDVVIDLADQVGFDGIDAGSLADSWRQQPGAPAYCRDLQKEALEHALKAADPSKVAEYRATAMAAAAAAVAAAGSLAAAAAGKH